MPEQLLDYDNFIHLRDSLAKKYENKIDANMSPNATFVYLDVYGKRLENGKTESIAERMAAVSVDVASNDLKYFSDEIPLEKRIEHVELRAKRYMELQANNVFRANTPTNINFGRWVAKYDEDGELKEYHMKSQLGSACFVIPVEDTFGDNAESVHKSDGILSAWVEQQLLQKGGGGTGLSGCALRPKGSIIGYNPVVDGMKSIDWNHQRGVSSGFESFLENYFNSSTEAVKQGNSRRGANMGVQRIDHMDFLDHIYAKHGRDKKRLEWRLKNFNLSMAVTDEFMDAAENGMMYTLYNPHRANPEIKNILEKKIKIKNPEIVRRDDIATREQFEKILERNKANPFAPLPTPSLYLIGDDVINAYSGDKIGAVLNNIVYIDAKEVLNKISELSHSNGEPGMIFIDRINENNPILPLKEYDATNPCGEQPLPPHTACNLGSINAEKFVRYKLFDSFEDASKLIQSINDKWAKVEERGDGKFGVLFYDWEELDKTIEDGIRFLDNVIDRNDFPSDKIINAVLETRKIGLGYMGVGDAIALMKLRYGNDDSIEFAEGLVKRLHDKSRETSMRLAEERGEFPLWDISFFNPKSEHYKWFMSNPESIRDRFRGERRLSDKVKRERKMSYGMKIRNSYQTTQAPTGTIRRTVGERDEETGESLIISSGVEPIFSLIEESKILNTKVTDFSSAMVKLLRREGVYSKKLIDAIRQNKGSVNIYSNTPPEIAKVLETVPESIRNVLVTSAGGEGDIYEINSSQHAKMVTTIQQYTDSAISKTIILPKSAEVKDVLTAWVDLWKGGAKGGTVYRDQSRDFQILNVVQNQVESVAVKGKRRPLLQASITLELPYNNSAPKENVGNADFNPDSCFTTITYNPVNGGITGVFQNIPETDPERISSITDRNIERSRALKNGRTLDGVIADLEKIKFESGTKGFSVDSAVMQEVNQSLRYQVEGGTTTENQLKTFYVVRFLTDGGENFDSEFIEERLAKYNSGEVSLRAIINSKGKIKFEMDNERNPSILGNGHVMKIPEGISKKLCPECG